MQRITRKMSYLKVGRPPRSREYLNSRKMYPYRGWYTSVVAFPPPPHPFHRLLNVFQRISAVIFIAETIRPWTAVYRLGYDEELEQPSPPYSPWLCRGKLRGEILENWRSGGGVAVACSGNWCSSCSRRNCLVLSANLADARRESSGSSVCESRERKGSAIERRA